MFEMMVSEQSKLWGKCNVICFINNIFCYIYLFVTVTILLFIASNCNFCEKSSYEISTSCQNFCTSYNDMNELWKIFIYWTEKILWCIVIGSMIFINHELRSPTMPAGNTIYKLLQIYGTFLILLTATIILSEAKLLHEGNPVYFVLGVIIFIIIAKQMIIFHKFYKETMLSATYESDMQRVYVQTSRWEKIQNNMQSTYNKPTY